MKALLSTKVLTARHKNRLADAGITLYEYNAIAVKEVGFKILKPAKDAIITSRNAAAIVAKRKIVIEKCYCVGKNTAAFLKDSGYEVVETADYGKDLAKIIVGKYRKENFAFFCGSRRHDALPNLLKANGVRFEETVVYRTEPNPIRWGQKFDDVLFFSPSGVQFFCSNNNPGDARAVCIGKTTAGEAGKFFHRVVVASEPTVGSVVDVVIW